MDTANVASAPAEWLAVIEEGEADLAAGRIVPGDVVMRELAEALARTEAKTRAKTGGEASARS